MSAGFFSTARKPLNLDGGGIGGTGGRRRDKKMDLRREAILISSIWQ